MAAPEARLGIAVDLLPEVVAERCVHARVELARCRACVDACPRGAWAIDDERLGIDANRCDGCGLCAPACPEGAVLARWEPARYRVDGQDLAFAACAATGVPAGPGLVSCLHVLGLRRLIELHRAGVRRLLLARAPCDLCPRGGVTRVEESHARVTLLLRERGRPSLELIWLEPEPWGRALATARARHRPAGLDRRAFFRRAAERVAEGVSDLASRDASGAPEHSPASRLIPRTGPGQRVLAAPRIDAQRCSGCHACARLCPHAVIELRPDGYHFDPDGCTGCGICADICAEAAVTVERLAAAPQTFLPLVTERCRGCGAEYQLPATTSPVGLCQVCARSGHHQRLFQVLG